VRPHHRETGSAGLLFYRPRVFQAGLSRLTARILPCCTDTATTSFKAFGANGNGPYSEEPREGKARPDRSRRALTRGS
jgi:hypothetical protein